MNAKEVRKLVYKMLADSYISLAEDLKRLGAPNNVVQAVMDRAKCHIKDSESKAILEQDSR